MKAKRKEPHAVYMVACPVVGTCEACGHISELTFRDGDSDRLICAACYDDVALANIMLKQLERGHNSNAIT